MPIDIFTLFQDSCFLNQPTMSKKKLIARTDLSSYIEFNDHGKTRNNSENKSLSIQKISKSPAQN